MRRYLGVFLLGVCLLALGSGATALAGSSAGGKTYYVGTNSQGQTILFSVDSTASGPQFDPILTTVVARCPATGDVLTAGFTFQGFQVPIKNGKFSLVLSDLQDLFSWSGTVTSTKASGNESYAFPAFDREGGLQDCTSGRVPWTAKALSGSSKTSAPRADYLVRVTKEPDGSVHFSITR
jgi:hypothetical protein